MIAAGYLLSLLMGLSLGMLGGGGSILTVPILVYFFSTPPLAATSESLFVVGSTALVGGLISFYNKEVHLPTVIKFAALSFVGVFFMKKIVFPQIPEVLFSSNGFIFTKALMTMAVFGFLMLLVSASMIRSRNKKASSYKQTKSIPSFKIGLNGFFVGNVTGLVGAGGGFLIVPALVNLVGLNMRQAVGSSLLIIAANSLFGFAVSLSSGLHPNWSVLVSILGISIMGLFIGRVFSKKVPEAQLKKGFGYFVLIMGSLILIDQILKLRL